MLALTKVLSIVDEVVALTLVVDKDTIEATISNATIAGSKFLISIYSPHLFTGLILTSGLFKRYFKPSRLVKEALKSLIFPKNLVDSLSQNRQMSNRRKH